MKQLAKNNHTKFKLEIKQLLIYKYEKGVELRCCY